jgi:hypothetical protein
MVNKFFKNRIVIFIIVAFLFSLLSIFVSTGYSSFSFDQRIYMPEVLKNIDGELFSRDFLSTFNQSSLTFFDELISGLFKITGINIFVLLLILSIVFKTLLFYCLLEIVYLLKKNVLFSILVVSFFLVPLSVYGTSTKIVMHILHPRTISLSLGLLFFLLFLKEKKMWASFSLGFSLLIHPLTSLPFIFFYYIFLAFNFFQKKKINFIFILELIIPFLFLFILLSQGGETGSIFSLISPLWRGIIEKETAFIFVSSWGWIPALRFLADIFLLAFLGRELFRIIKTNKYKREFMLLFVFIPFFFLALSFVGVDIFNLSFLAKLQISRALIFFKILIIITSVIYTIEFLKKDEGKNLFLSLTLSGLIFSYLIFDFAAIFFIFLLALFELKSRIKIKKEIFVSLLATILALAVLGGLVASFYFAGVKIHFLRFVIILILSLIISLLAPSLKKLKEKYFYFLCFLLILLIIPFRRDFFGFSPSYFGDKELVSACEWVQENTKKDDLFLAEPFSSSQALRFGCLRSVFYAESDKVQVVFDSYYASEWRRRGFWAGEVLISGDFKKLKKEKIDYVFSKEKLNLESVYSNSKYYIYKLK